MAKQVFHSSELPDLYLTKAQQSARTTKSQYTGTPALYFEGDIMYSYGSHFPMSRIIGSTLIIAKRESSVTTNKHLWSLRNDALGLGFDVLEVADVMADDIESHNRNIRDLLDQVDELFAKSERARKPSIIEGYKQDARNKANDAVAYEKLFC